MISRNGASCLALLLFLVLAIGSDDSPSEDYVPQFSGYSQGCVFSYDITFQLSEIKKHIRTKSEQGAIQEQTVAFQGSLGDVKLKIVCHYSQGGDREETVFWSEWQAGKYKVVRMPAPSSLQGYDLSGTADIRDVNGNYIKQITINQTFRLHAD